MAIDVPARTVTRGVRRRQANRTYRSSAQDECELNEKFGKGGKLLRLMERRYVAA